MERGADAPRFFCVKNIRLANKAVVAEGSVLKLDRSDIVVA
jgi:hypothetical protein